MSRAATCEVSVVVPVYGGEATVAELAQGLAAALRDRDWELLFVCDRPRDGSWAQVQKLAAENPRVRALLFRRNYGQHPALLCGIRLARGRTVVTMDEDLQHNPADVPALVAVAEQEQALVYGVSAELHHGGFRNLSSRLLKRFLASYLGVDFGRNMSAFRAFPSQAREAFADYRSAMVAIDVLLSWAALPVRALPCAHAPRRAGASGYTFAKLMKLMGDVVLGFSVAPLRLATWAGLAAMLGAFALAAVVGLNWLLHGSAVPGFAFLGLAVTLLGGVQLLALGLLGEYLGRLYGSALGRPQYLVAERTWREPEAR
ncbi:MAG: glycosyltransferase family 2 protein [Deltaproteobacteria bacterium]|nr:glycosyltransferase family 2 protein [Deltaproteobacteria bacterium]